MLRKQSNKTIPKLKREAWAEFSKFIRLRDCKKTTGTYHQGRCYTCDFQVEYKGSQAGHFVPGRHASLLFHEDNCHLQCRMCNVWRHGDWPNYYEHMIEDYGKTFVESLIKEGHATKHWDRTELESLKTKYQQKVIDLIGK